MFIMSFCKSALSLGLTTFGIASMETPTRKHHHNQSCSLVSSPDYT